MTSLGVHGSASYSAHGFNLEKSSKISCFKSWGSLRSLLMRQNSSIFKEHVGCLKSLWSLGTAVGFTLDFQPSWSHSVVRLSWNEWESRISRIWGLFHSFPWG